MKGARQMAEIRGDIQQGRTGDKKPGFDPAAVPMETDAEAAGVRLPHGEVARELRDQPGPLPGDRPGSRADAMRPFSHESGARGWQPTLLAAAVAAVVTVLLILMIAML